MGKLFNKLKTGLEELEDYQRGTLKDTNVRISRRKLEIEPVNFKFTPEQIKGLRIKLGLSQSQFAQALGVQLVTVSKWEQGLNPPQPSSLRLLEVLLRKPSILSELAILKVASK